MDRGLYVVMNAAQQTMIAQAVNTNNLANASTTGFRADIDRFTSKPVYGDGLASRAYAQAGKPSVDLASGTLESTGRNLDIAIKGDGFIAVQGKDGKEAYTRAGNLHVSAAGQLETATGLTVLGDGGPISVPPSQSIAIGADGTISVRALGDEANTVADVGRIKLVNLKEQQVFKGSDGLIRMKNGNPAQADANVQVVSGYLESSNVNTVDSLVKMIALQRQYEGQINMMKTLRENSQASQSLMQLNV